MKYIMEHFGPAVVAAAVFILIGGLIAGLLANDGAIAKEFASTITNFFTQMKAATGI